MAKTAVLSLKKQTHSDELDISQQAPIYLSKTAAGSLSTSISLLSTAESSEQWITYEQLLLSCLRTGDDKSAHLCLERLTTRFGASNERIMGLRGLFQEAVAEDSTALSKVLQDYDTILTENPTIVPVAKRRIALLKTLSRSSEAISALVQLLAMSPIDAEAWAELSDIYLIENLYQQAIFCLEEVLLITPNAWNIHARLGEVLYMSTISAIDSKDNNAQNTLFQAVQRFSRSIELCDRYLRGYYGLKLVTDRLIALNDKYGKESDQSSMRTGMPMSTIKNLNKIAREEISDIVHRPVAGYDQADVISAKELLDRRPLMK